MQYNSWLYLFPFLGGSIILYYLIPVKRRWIGLLFSSLLFYILAMKNLVAVVLFTTATIYLGARTIEEFNEQFKLKKKELDRAARKELKSKITKKNRYVIALLCVINFGILFITKYFNFFGENINTLFHALHISAQIPFLDISALGRARADTDAGPYRRAGAGNPRLCAEGILRRPAEARGLHGRLARCKRKQPYI